MKVSVAGFVVFLIYFISFFFSRSCSAGDTLDANQSLKDGDTIVSAEGTFEMGFFNPGKSQKLFLGIWYKKIATGTVVWVANRGIPLNDSAGVLTFSDKGNLVLVNGTNSTIWSSTLSRSTTNPVARLLDTGNLVVADVNDPRNFLWQSFDYPGSTFLAGMKAGIDLRTGLKRDLTSWKSPDDPSVGEYSNRLHTGGVPQFLLWKGSVLRFRSGPWNGLRFSGMPNLKPNHIYTFEFVFNDEEIYYKYELINSSVVTRMELNSDGALRRYIWIDRTQEWNLYLGASMDDCDRYALCGAYGSCDINNSPTCGCLKGFVPKFPEEWVAADWSNGCVRKVSLDCREGEDFLKYSGVKLPDTQQSWYNKTMNLEECKQVCLKNCSCTAYASMDISGGGSGCILWFNELIDIRQYNENGQDIYIRLAASEIAAYRSSIGKERMRKIIIPVLSSMIVFLGLFLIFIVWKKGKKRKRKGAVVLNQEQNFTEKRETDDLELPLFDFVTLTDATDCFSMSNKLSEGGFGPVYKGILKDGQEIAVKRLSTTSRQGIDEFKNEVSFIVKLQHRNLVKLLGCCIHGEERLLIYEYMPNKSLDFFIFDQNKSRLLDWPKRFNIINGIARGLLYLHQDSRLRIIHRDLKASNILLDNDMNPKISDFGLARSFGEDESAGNTKKVVGTYGYMSPEYAIDGLFSVKSDVFSFGVLVLEIVSGKKNRGFTHSDHRLNLLGHAWRLFNDDKSEELIDESVDSCNVSEVLRSIHVGLLCVQQSPEHRPRMSTVVLMLSSDVALPKPNKPGFYAERSLIEGDSSTGKQDASSTNEVTVTLLEPR
ncbi:G-type lectin S-receptor-like serine/threonine-protein kinase At4g27290 [Mangifera indica]|uniref:G-type lectin S-receptor-like serine/threonine-protein kinase At4g27290 n=1 Tax=Mangifera indica TaxID=29780 RepID=UPI001CFC10BE|nr:G-type lectin S-receptor-like serine/threonine-protein kinase At4g27290 [Mangifera indica]